MSTPTDEETAQPAPKLATLSKYSQFHLDAATPPDKAGLDKASTDGLRGSDTSSDSALYIALPASRQQRARSDDSAAARDAQRLQQEAEYVSRADTELENNTQVAVYISRYSSNIH